MYAAMWLISSNRLVSGGLIFHLRLTDEMDMMSMSLSTVSDALTQFNHNLLECGGDCSHFEILSCDQSYH